MDVHPPKNASIGIDPYPSRTSKNIQPKRHGPSRPLSLCHHSQFRRRNPGRDQQCRLVLPCHVPCLVIRDVEKGHRVTLDGIEGFAIGGDATAPAPKRRAKVGIPKKSMDISSTTVPVQIKCFNHEIHNQVS